MSFLNITGYKRLTIFIWLTGILVTTNIELAANQPKWIWNSKDAKDGEKAFFRKKIRINKETKSANLIMSCDNGFEAFVNGKKVLVGSEWGNAQKTDVKKHLKPGMNLIAVKAWNVEGVAGLVGKLEVVSLTDRHKSYFTDDTWRSTNKEAKGWNLFNFDTNGWKTATETGVLGDNPWGNVFALAQQGGTDLKNSNPADLKLSIGFKSELL